MRLIDTDEILTRIQKAYVDTELGTNKRAVAINIGLTKALNNVQDCKKIELKKGRWNIKLIRPVYGGVTFRVDARCSECGVFIAQTTTQRKMTYRFCPFCGARMEGIDETD